MVSRAARATGCRLGNTDMPLLVGKTFPYEPSMAAICEERVRSYIRAWGGLVSVVDVCLAEAIPLTSQERRRRWSRNAGLARHTWWAAKSGGCVGWRGGCGGEDRVTCASRRACLRQPAEQSDRDVVSRRACLYYQGRYVLETRQTKPTNDVAERDGEAGWVVVTLFSTAFPTRAQRSGPPSPSVRFSRDALEAGQGRGWSVARCQDDDLQPKKDCSVAAAQGVKLVILSGADA